MISGDASVAFDEDGSELTHSEATDLQRLAGNRAVGTAIQATSGYTYPLDSDRTAQAVMRAFQGPLRKPSHVSRQGSHSDQLSAFASGAGISLPDGNYAPSPTPDQELAARKPSHVVRQGTAVQRKPLDAGTVRRHSVKLPGFDEDEQKVQRKPVPTSEEVVKEHLEEKKMQAKTKEAFVSWMQASGEADHPFDKVDTDFPSAESKVLAIAIWSLLEGDSVTRRLKSITEMAANPDARGGKVMNYLDQFEGHLDPSTPARDDAKWLPQRYQTFAKNWHEMGLKTTDLPEGFDDLDLGKVRSLKVELQRWKGLIVEAGRGVEDFQATATAVAFGVPEAKFLSPELKDYASKGGRLDIDALVTEYEQKHTKPAIEQAERYKSITTADLLKMPTAAALYDAAGKFFKKSQLKVYDEMLKQRQSQAESDGVKLDPAWNKSKEADVAYMGHTGKFTNVKQNEKDVKKKTVSNKQYGKIQDGWKRLQAFVEPEILAKIPPPKVRIIQSLLFRAEYKNSTKTVYVSSWDDVPTIVHETGHHLEYNVPEKTWAAFHGLLYQRQAEATEQGKTELQDMGGTMKGELHYPVATPATGAYTAKHYKGGGGEWMSMGPQYLSEPKKAKKLMDKDPQYAAILFKEFMPREFAEAGLDKFGEDEVDSE